MLKKIAAIAILALALSSTIGCAVLTRWRRSMSDLTLTLTVPRTKYAIGEEVDLKVEVTNQTSKLVVFPKIDEAQAPQPIYLIRQPDGNIVTYDPLVGDPELRERKTLPRYLMTGIEPGNSINTYVMPKDSARLDQPGDYTVTARFKWNDFHLESEPVTFKMAAIHISTMVMSEFVRDPETPPISLAEDAGTWGWQSPAVVFRVSEDIVRPRLGEAMARWSCSDPMSREFVEWGLGFGERIWVSGQDLPAGAGLTPIQTTGVENGDETLSRLAWTRNDLWLGWPAGKQLEGFPWHRIPSPQPIAYGLRYLANDLVQQLEEHDAFAIFEGEAAELGHVHIKTFINNVTLETREEHTPLRPIAQLGPDLAAAQVMIGQPEMGSPIVLVAIRTVPTGMQATFLRIDSKGAVVAKVQKAIAGFKPLGPVAMRMRVRGVSVEAAFPAMNKYTNTLHVVRLATTVDLQSIQPPIVSAPIPLEGPVSSMVIDYSHFPAFFPNGVGLLLRQQGDKAFFWTEARGLKPLPFTLHDKDEALIVGKRSSWYVLVNNGIRLRGETVESFYEEYRHDLAPQPAEPPIE
jgi:hypothetical protein